MVSCLLAVAALVVNPAAHLPTLLRPVAPDTPSWLKAGTERKDRAVILIHGLRLYPFRPQKAGEAEIHEWQEPRSELVRALAKDADVFAFGYAQTVPVDLVPHALGLRDAVAKCKAAGYPEVVLIGHSAGGVVARLFAEAYPDAGVTKVIQVAAPHGGADMANAKAGYPKMQAPFVRSLAPDFRTATNRDSKRQIAAGVQVVSVVCKLRGFDADGLVKVESQWPPLLQRQGIPAVLVYDSHWTVMRTPAGVRAIAGLVRDPLVRWSPEQVEVARKVLFRDADEPKK